MVHQRMTVLIEVKFAPRTLPQDGFLLEKESSRMLEEVLVESNFHLDVHFCSIDH